MKKILLGIVIGGLVFGTITGVVALNYNAKDIGYTPKDTSWEVETVEDALKDLKDNRGSSTKKFCTLKSGNALAIGSMYECDPGDGTKRNFYALKVSSDGVELIMDRNINNGTMSWNNAMKYIKNNNLNTSWKNVANVDLPKAQSIADAVGNSSFVAADSGATWWCFGSKKQDMSSSPYCNSSTNQPYAWLFNHLNNCTQAGCTDSSDASANGYWTRDLISNTAYAWPVGWGGYLSYDTVSNATLAGVRPVITVLKGNLR